MTDDIAQRTLASKVPLLANFPLLGQVNEPDAIVSGNQILNVFPVREDQ